MRVLTRKEKKAVAQAAYDLLNEYSIDASNGVDIVELAHQMGFVVGNAGLDDGDDGFIMVNEDADEILGIKTKKLIGVNADRDYEKKRFIIAHEIGHYTLHCKGGKIFAHRDSTHGRSDEENKLDYFAACLLMPKEAFEKAFKENDIEQLSKIFEVPVDSVKRRILELKLSVGE